MLLALILLGRYLEILAKGRTSDVLTKLLELQPTTALLLLKEEEGEVLSEQEISVELLQYGDLLKVVPGSKVPLDGVVVFGSTTVDESMVTGESMPVSKVIGSSVYGGTVNQSGTIHMRTTSTAAGGTLATINRLVEEAQGSKPNIQRIADRIAAYFIPIILLLSLTVFVLWCILAATDAVDTGGLFVVPFGLQFGITVLVVSCPCAIGLAAPTAIMVGTGLAAKHGILFKGGPVLETCRKVSTVVFDKTGTLTHGKPVVTSFCMLSETPLDPHDFWYLVGSAELGSEHVLGKAVAAHARQETPRDLDEPTDFTAVPGKGLYCGVGDRAVVIGNRIWMQEHDLPIPQEAEATVAELEDAGNTVIWVAVDSRLVGTVALADTPKPEAKGVIRELQKMGMEIWMISGDNERTAAAVGSDLGIAQVMGGVMPGDKSDKIAELQSDGKRVAMVGDGINDSPALARADVGIAVGAGTDIALEAADVVLMKSDLKDVLLAIHLSKITYRVILTNFVWAFLYNAVAIPLAAGILFPADGFVFPPAAAGLAELLSSLPVVCFSLLLKLLYRVPKSIRRLNATTVAEQDKN